jgi:subtilase family serine protease
MYRFLRFGGPLTAALCIAACSASGSSSVTPASVVGAAHAPQWRSQSLARPACPDTQGLVHCLALIESSAGRHNTSGYGWTAQDIEKAYNLPSSTKGSGQLVAIVDSYDNPHVASDLAVYRSHFGLGKVKFKKFNQDGQQKNYPPGNPGWGVEIDLDVEMVSAACPKCSIDLIEAGSSTGNNSDAAEAEAVKLGAHIVSNSWICYGYSCVVDPKYFDKPGVIYTAGSGDEGYGVIGPPMAYPTVDAVGGTELAYNSSSGYSETVWDGAGAGCTEQVTKPKWQHDPDCSNRTDADVSAVAWDVAEYDTYTSTGSGGGWFSVGGTSVATPLIAGTYALAGNAKSQHGPESLWKLKKNVLKNSLHYISSGNDGDCNGEYLCTAGTNQYGTYSGPAGWGTPNGIGAF